MWTFYLTGVFFAVLLLSQYRRIIFDLPCCLRIAVKSILLQLVYIIYYLIGSLSIPFSLPSDISVKLSTMASEGGGPTQKRPRVVSYPNFRPAGHDFNNEPPTKKGGTRMC